MSKMDQNDSMNDKFLGGLKRVNPSNAGDKSRSLPTSETTVNDGTREKTAKTNSQSSREA